MLSDEKLPIIEESIHKLLLDTENPRFPAHVANQQEAANELFTKSDALSLVEDILRDGYIDNEVPLVTQVEGDRYVILEGNRRVSALKAIADPKSIPEWKNKIEALKKKYEVESTQAPSAIRVMMISDRKEALPILEKLHVGQAKNSWGSFEQANFYLTQLEIYGDLETLKSMFPKADSRKIKLASARRFLTSVRFKKEENREYVRSDAFKAAYFERLYSNEVIAQGIGIEFDNDGRLKPLAKAPEEIGTSLKGKQLQALERVINDFRVGKLNTRSEEFKKGTEEQEELIFRVTGKRSIRESSSTPEHQEDGSSSTADAEQEEPTAASENTASQSTDRGQSNAGNRSRQRRGNETTLHIADLDLGTLPVNMKHRIEELEKIKVKDAPYATAMLMRSVLETSIKLHYTRAKQSKKSNGTLNEVVKNVHADYKNNNQLKNCLGPIYSGAVHAPGSVRWFNSVTHDPNFSIDEATVRTAWRAVEPLIRFLLQ